ncbi:MAG: hypothetical protein RL722_2150, partial [Pseudomonadota bacterium]
MPNRAPIRSRQHPQTALVRSLPRWAVCLGLAGSLLAAHPASWAADPKAAVTGGKTSPIKPPVTSPMTGDLMFQLMISEMELQRDEAGAAFERLMETARRYRHEEVYKRAVDVALAARAGDQALVAVKAWRQAWPRSRQPVELQTQILTAMGRVTEVVEPLRAMIELTPVAERSSVVASVPRLLGRDAERNAKAAPVLVEALEPWRKDANTRASAAVASGRIWLAVNEADKSFDLARAAQKAEPQAEGPALLALELMARKPEAEELVKAYLKAKPQPAAVIQLAYARRLTASQRFAEAVSQVQKVSAATPDLPDPYLLLGALQLELADPKAAEVALTRYLDLRQNSRPASPAAAASAPGAERDEAADDEGDDDGESDADAEGSLAQ